MKSSKADFYFQINAFFFQENWIDKRVKYLRLIKIFTLNKLKNNTN